MKNNLSKFNNFIRDREVLNNDKLTNVENSINLGLYSKKNSNQTSWMDQGRNEDHGDRNEYLNVLREHKQEAHSNNNSVAEARCCQDHMGQNDEAATGTTTANVKRVLGLPYVQLTRRKLNLTNPTLRNLTSIKVFLHQINEFIGFEGKFYVCAVLLYCFIVSAITMYVGERSSYA